MRPSPLRRGLAVAILAAPLFAGAPSASAQAPAGSRTETSGPVQATLSWQGEEAGVVGSPRLRIDREGVQRVDDDLTRACELCSGLGAVDPGSALRLRDLDGDGEPEVLVDMFSGGAHCCWSTVIYRWVPADGGYRRSVASWGNGFYRLRDLDRDGRPELVSSDDRFAYAFTAYALSWRPPRIFAYRQGRLLDRTRSFPRLVRADLRAIDRLLPRARRGGDPRGLIAARVADMELLGLRRGVNRYLARALRRGDLAGDPGWPAGRRFKPALLRFLRRAGYR